MDANPPPDRPMDPAAEPVVENPAAPAMDSVAHGDVMDGPLADAPGPRMTEPAPQATDEEAAGYPDMEPRQAPPSEGEGAEAFAADEQGEGYLRLVIEVEGDDLRLIDAAVVEGPLVQTDLTGQMAYEALVRGRRVAADAFDDLSRQRGFAPPDDPAVGHSDTELSKYQFVARIPRSEVTTEELADLEITLLRPSRTTQLSEDVDTRSAESLSDAAVAAGEVPPEVIGRLRGIDLDASLPQERAQAVRRRLP